ncbi:MAG: hypothetical protein IJF64_03005 [Clostridia bacterium]|nr:hypothetical protein [Clostridia bacterium]
MYRFFKDKRTLKNCHIYQMLRSQNGRHLSFHTPGHKRKGWDITELSYSDNLSAPSGCIFRAEQDITKILRSTQSFLLTDGSTSGVLSMLYAAKSLGVRSVCFLESSHKSVYNGCSLLGLTPLLLPQKQENNIPLPPTVYELNSLLDEADALLLTYPDYYGNVIDLKPIQALCKEKGKLLLIDGAHGSHLHFNEEIYAGTYADFWVDGVHKNLPTLTQGAVVSTNGYGEALKKAVDIFRTTSPSYPIMASVEYGIKYPENKTLQERVLAMQKENDRIYKNGDWTKLCVLFGKNAFQAEKEFQKRGIYPEFCDGNVLLFYLSPATSLRSFEKLKRNLRSILKKLPYIPNEEIKRTVFEKLSKKREWIELNSSLGRVCAAPCGLFPPCVPLLVDGEKIGKEKIALLKKADNTFGTSNGKICVYKEV